MGGSHERSCSRQCWSAVRRWWRQSRPPRLGLRPMRRWGSGRLLSSTSSSGERPSSTICSSAGRHLWWSSVRSSWHPRHRSCMRCPRRSCMSGRPRSCMRLRRSYTSSPGPSSTTRTRACPRGIARSSTAATPGRAGADRLRSRDRYTPVGTRLSSGAPAGRGMLKLRSRPQSSSNKSVIEGSGQNCSPPSALLASMRLALLPSCADPHNRRDQ